MTEPRGAIYLINRAPIDITYQHTIDFKSPEEQMSFWGSKVKFRLSEYQYLRRDRRYFRIEKTFEELEGINYLYYQSRENSKYYFAFVTDRVYINDDVTELYFEIDVLQSFMFDYSFKPSYISQAHVDRWDASHKPIYSRTDEGLNYGSEYITEAAYKIRGDFGYKGKDGRVYYDYGFYLIYMIPFEGTSDGLSIFDEMVIYENAGVPTTINGNPIPYKILLVPEVKGEVISRARNSKILSNMHEVLRFMANSSFGNHIHQITYVPYLPFTHKFEMTPADDGIDWELYLGTECKDVTISGKTSSITILSLERITNEHLLYKDSPLASLPIFDGLENKIPNADMWTDIKANPLKTERDRRFESKLLVYPYRYNIFTDWISPSVIVKNEYIGGDSIDVKMSIGFGFNTPRRFWIDKYRNEPEGREASLNQLIPFEQPVINDQYYTYLLNNKNQIAANLANAKINATSGVISSAISGAVSGASMGAVAGPWGAVAGAVGGAISGGIGSAIQGQIGISNMLRSENAKQNDLKNLPDTISNSNDVTLAIADGATYLTFYRKAITCDFEEQLSQYWNMFGYKVNRVMIPNLRSRMRYNFIKTIGANIVGDIESAYLAAIKAIYDNGVTIWHYSETDFNPLDYSYENIERNLL